MKSIFRATAILSGSSVITILLSLVSAKVMALYLQPEGYGYYGLLQSFAGVASLIVGMGMSTGIVRLGAAAATRNDVETVASLRKAAWVVFFSLSLVAALMLLAFRNALSQWALGSTDHTSTILWMGAAFLFTAAGNVQIGILNTYHRVGALAKYAVVNAILGAVAGIAIILIWRIHGVVAASIALGVSAWLVSTLFLRREVGPNRVHVDRKRVMEQVWSLLRFGGPYTASMFVGTGVQLLLPMVVLHMLSTESVGYYRAAVGISVGYLSFLINAMSQDYYPRVSAVADSPSALVKLINDQHRLVMLLAVPAILGTLTIVPYLVPLVYSLKFQPTVEILEWQLIGDIFKFSSWTMSFVILARAGSSTYFLIESISGITTLATTWVAVRWFGLPGLGISFLATYVVYYAVVWIVTRREIPLVWTTANKRMMLAGVTAALIIRLLPSTRFAHYKTLVAWLLTLAIGLPSLWVVLHEFKQLRGTGKGGALQAEAEKTSAATAAP